MSCTAKIENLTWKELPCRLNTFTYLAMERMHGTVWSPFVKLVGDKFLCSPLIAEELIRKQKCQRKFQTAE